MTAARSEIERTGWGNLSDDGFERIEISSPRMDSTFHIRFRARPKLSLDHLFVCFLHGALLRLKPKCQGFNLLQE